MTSSRYQLWNIDRGHSIPHVPESVEHDRGIVLDRLKQEPHPITGKLQPSVAFRGTVPECATWITRHA